MKIVTITIKSGQKEVNKKKKQISVLDMALFFYLLEQPNYSGFNLEQYIEITIRNNANQMYRQVLIDIQQQKDLEIENNEFQRIISQQNNQKLCINGEKISGFIDLQLIGLNNLAKAEGIKKEDKNAKVKFVAVTDGKETKMCNSLDGQEFYIDKENIFNRYYGETQKELRIERIRCNGLVLGLNLPPITHHFHYCRSYIVYVKSVEKQVETEYNLEVPKINKDVHRILENTKINKNVQKLFNRYLTDENIIIDTDNDKPMYYDINKDKIVINPNHSEIIYYDLEKSLTHEIAHMIDIRNDIKIKDITKNIRKARIDILSDKDKYNDVFNYDRYSDNMELSDVFSAITQNQITGNYIHDNDYWENKLNVERELKADMFTAYLTENKDLEEIAKSIKPLNNIRKEVIKAYVKRIS